MSTVTNQMQNDIESFEKEKNSFIEKMKVKLEDAFKEFFQENPAIKTITWTQFTPYFNDGEACEFSINDPIFALVEYDEDKHNSPYDFEEDEDSVAYPHPWNKDDDKKHESYENCKNLSKILNSSSMEEVLQTAFGDGVFVVVSENGIEVLEYEHD